jgi:hypothetical protein
MPFGLTAWQLCRRQSIALGALCLASITMIEARPHSAHAAEPESSRPPLPGASPEYDAAFAAMAADPGNSDKTLAFADKAARAGDLEGAIAALERILVFNPNLPTIRAQLGTLYYRLGSYALAQSYLDKALASPDLPPAMAEAARKTRDLAIDAGETNHFSGTLSFGLRGQTNANAGPNGGISRILGFDLQLSDKFQNQNDENLFGALTLHHSYDPHWASGITWDSNFSIYGAKQFHLLQLSLASVNFDTGPRIPVTGWAGDIVVRPYLVADAVLLASNPYNSDYGAGVSAIVPVDEKATIASSIETRNVSYHATSQGPRSNDQAGPTTIVTVAPSYALTDAILLSLTSQTARVDSRAPYQSYWRHTLLPTVNYGFETSLWDGLWQSSLYFGRSWSNYDGVDELIDPATKRHDREWDLGGSLGVPIAGNVSLQFQIQQAWDESSIPNYSFSNFTGQTAVVIGF